jgi:hypothetical protein
MAADARLAVPSDKLELAFAWFTVKSVYKEEKENKFVSELL